MIASEVLLVRISDPLKAMADPVRLKIIHCLHEGERTVSEIQKTISGDTGKTVLSQHLAILRKVGLINSRRQGRDVLYRAHEGTLAIYRNVCDSLELRIDQGERYCEEE